MVRRDSGLGFAGLVLASLLHCHDAGAAERRIALEDRAGLHDGFARLVFSGTAGKPVSFTATVEGRRLRVHFARPVKFSLRPIQDGLDGYAVDPVLSVDGRTLTAHLQRPVRLRQSTIDANRLVVDLIAVAAEQPPQKQGPARTEAKSRDPDALAHAMAMLHSGHLAEALPLLQPLAAQGNAQAQSTLGSLYLYSGVLPNHGTEGVSWLRKAADQGYAEAEDTLGVTYEMGGPVPQDYAQAVAWFRKAADAGYAHSQGNLGAMYQNGWGVPKDIAQAEKLYRQGAAGGDPQAQAYLGIVYQNGLVRAPDFAEAAKWYLRAAYRGVGKAQYNLAVMYAVGQGMPSNPVQAYMWFDLASRSSDLPRGLAASHRDAEAAHMTTAQLAEAKQEIREWAPPDS